MGFKKYDLTESQLKKIARLCVQEQGCIAGVKAEASQAANLLETNAKYRNKYGSDIYSFMRNSEWYARAAHYMDDGSASSSAMSGDAVKVWQIIVGVTPDGDFGSWTLDATVNFQTAHGLDGDGIVGHKTWTEGLKELS